MSQQPPATPAGEANTQYAEKRSAKWPEWVKQLPKLKFEPEEPDEKAPLISQEDLEVVFRNADPDAVTRIRKDIDFMDYELLRLFRIRDHEAKKQQNRYRLYQISYLILAASATLIGSLQALTLTGDPNVLPFFAFAETLIALVAIYLTTISGREPPLLLWMENRRRAEQLRREYFLFLANLPPYDQLEGYRRSVLLSKRAAEINRGNVPPEPDVQEPMPGGSDEPARRPQ
jgi:hypothetical protein